MLTLSELAHDFATDLAADAQTGDCCCPPSPEGSAGLLAPRFGFTPHPLHEGALLVTDNAHRLGTQLSCPTCWAWHQARRQPHPDQRAYVAHVLQEQRELAGEQHDALAQEIVAAFAAGPGPAESTSFFERLECLSARLRKSVMPSTRRRLTVHNMIGYLVMDSKIHIGLRLAGWASAHLPARDGRGCGHTGRDCGCSYPDHGDDSVPF